MKRNIILTLIIILGIIVLMFIGDVITIGEKLTRVTHLWWMEYAFYALILLAFCWLVIRPIVKLHRTPELPSLNHEGVNNVVELKKFGARLAENCNYISDEKMRVDHQLQLRNDVQQWHDEQNLRVVIDREVQLRLHGDAALGCNLGSMVAGMKDFFLNTFPFRINQLLGPVSQFGDFRLFNTCVDEGIDRCDRIVSILALGRCDAQAAFICAA